MSDKITLAEGSDEFKAIKKEWSEKAKEMTIKDLPDFLTELTEKYQHDYGTICHAMTVSAIASLWAMNKSDQGGITGFQAGAIMWEFIREWNYSSNKTGLKLIDYDNFLYPQYKDNYDKKLSADTWKAIQIEAEKNIKEADKEYEEYLIKSEQYKKDINLFVEKHPNYYDNKEHYNHLGMGTGAEWDEEKKKKESGFEFAPSEPYLPVDSESPVYKHWASIVSGRIPFGYIIED